MFIVRLAWNISVVLVVTVLLPLGIWAIASVLMMLLAIIATNIIVNSIIVAGETKTFAHRIDRCTLSKRFVEYIEPSFVII